METPKEMFNKIIHDENYYLFMGLYGGIPKQKYYIYDEFAFSQVGEVETKLSLDKGIIMRDPTRDKRIIEFCLSLPISQSCKDGIDRRLCREYMKGIIPDSIRLSKQRGVQASDWIERIKEDLEKEYNKIKAIDKTELSKIVDFDRIDKIYNEIKEDISLENELKIRELIIILITIKFFSNNI